MSCSGGRAGSARVGLGRSLYVAAWMSQYGEAMIHALRDSSRRRRWLPGDGTEWGLLAAAPHYTAAHHILRLLLGGLPGGARWRGDEDRAQRACCSSCQRPLLASP